MSSAVASSFPARRIFFLYFFNLKTGTITRGRLAGLKTQPHGFLSFNRPSVSFTPTTLENDFLYTKLRPTEERVFPD